MPITTDGGKDPDGIFLSETRDTVKKFQRFLPDPVSDDGVIGKNTMAKLDAYFRHESPVKPPAAEGAVHGNDFPAHASRGYGERDHPSFDSRMPSCQRPRRPWFPRL
jgi:hypothetical protein